MLTTLLLRVAFLKLHINAADTMARLATLTPHMAPIKERISAAKLTQDMEALNLASAEMKRLYLAANIEVWRMFLPFLVQIPLGFATFRLLRGMATLPVPGLDEGGLLWLKDLTLSDPYFILPMAVGGAFYWTMKVCNNFMGAIIVAYKFTERRRYRISPNDATSDEKANVIRFPYHYYYVHARASWSIATFLQRNIDDVTSPIAFIPPARSSTIPSDPASTTTRSAIRLRLYRHDNDSSTLLLHTGAAPCP